MTKLLWSTWNRRNWTLIFTAIALAFLEHSTGDRWLGLASDIAFAGAMFCWGASHVDDQYEDCDCEAAK